jgi:transcriptional regulator with XRE-family HTH domain
MPPISDMIHVAKIECSKREPGVRTASKLARAVEVSVAVLFRRRRWSRQPSATGS